MDGEERKGTNIHLAIVIYVIIAGIVLLIIGINYKVPSREFSFYGIEKYVGGDAYNAIIESGIRGGEISGAMATKAIYICSGVITMSLGVLGIKKK